MLYQTENRHGGDVYGGGITLDFSANTNPLGTPPGVLEAVRRGLPQLHRYPDPYCRQNTLLLHLNGHIGGIEQFPSGDAGKDKVTSFQCLGAFRAGADTHGSDGVTDGQVEARLLG